jgi:hypothetical protein
MNTITLALVVTGWSTSLEIRTFLGPTVDDEIRRGSVNPLLSVWVWTAWTLLSASFSSGPRRLHTLFSPLNYSPFQPPSQSGTDLTTNQDKSTKRKTTDKSPQTSDPSSALVPPFYIFSPLSIRTFLFSAENGNRRARRLKHFFFDVVFITFIFSLLKIFSSNTCSRGNINFFFHDFVVAPGLL